MPELPEVETFRVDIIDKIAKEPDLSELSIYWFRHKSPIFRFLPRDEAGDPDFGPIDHNFQKITGVRRIGKILMIEFEYDHPKFPNVLAFQLGMSGHFRFEECYSENFPNWDLERTNSKKHDHLAISIGRPGFPDHTYLVYSDPRKFGKVFTFRAEDSHPWISRLGPDPILDRLGKYNHQHLQNKFTGNICPVKIAILDQTFIAGVGNIYASEALWHSRIHPQRSCCKLGSLEIGFLLDAIYNVLSTAIVSRGSTISSYKTMSGQAGSAQKNHAVYNRAGQRCVREDCDGVIQMIRMEDRSTYFCPTCQL